MWLSCVVQSGTSAPGGGLYAIMPHGCLWSALFVSRSTACSSFDVGLGFWSQGFLVLGFGLRVGFYAVVLLLTVSGVGGGS